MVNMALVSTSAINLVQARLPKAAEEHHHLQRADAGADHAAG
jgi:hypothetical protein